MATSQDKLRQQLKQKAKGAWKRSKDKAPEIRTGGPSAGIRDGAAQYVGHEFDSTDKGDPYFRLKFVVLEPAEEAGAQFSRFHFINDSEYSTVEDNLDALSGDLQICGADTSSTNDIDEIFPILDELDETKPFVTFNSWEQKKGKNKGNVRCAINEPITEESDPDRYEALTTAADEVEVEADEEKEEKKASSKTSKGPAKSTPAKGGKKTEPEPEPEPDESEADAEGDAEADTSDQGAEWEPAEGDIYGYPDPKTKKVTNWEVTLVDKRKEVVRLEHPKTKKELDNIPWKDLVTAI